MITAYVEMWKRTFDFTGLTTRKNYWLAFLMTWIILVAIGVGYSLIGLDESISSILGLITLILIFPNLSMQIRRLRDAGRGWGFIFLNALPLLSIVVIILLAMPSDPEAARRQQQGAQVEAPSIANTNAKDVGK